MGAANTNNLGEVGVRVYTAAKYCKILENTGGCTKYQLLQNTNNRSKVEQEAEEAAETIRHLGNSTTTNRPFIKSTLLVLDLDSPL